MNTPECGTHYVTSIRTHNSQRIEHKNIYFPFVRLEKMFFPEEGSLEDRGNIYGQLYRCLIPSISSQFSVQ